MIAIHRPYSLIELAMVRSLLAANDIPYYVHNAGYASLYPGIQIDLLNVPTVMVPEPLAESARELIQAYLVDCAEHVRSAPEESWWHFFRLLGEAVLCGWCVPRIGRDPGGRRGTPDAD